MAKIPEILVRIQIERLVLVSSTRIFRITSGGGRLISVEMFQPKFTVPFLTNQFLNFPFLENSKKEKNGGSHS